MSKNQYAARIDVNQPSIIEKLKQIPGMTIALNHDDILIGLIGFTFWYEIKSDQAKKKSGGYKKGAVKGSQIKLKNEFSGHYSIVGSYNDIIRDMIAFFDRLMPFNYVSNNLKRFLEWE